MKENEAPSEDIFMRIMSKRLYDKRIYTGVSGQYSFVQSVLSQSYKDFREQLVEDLGVIFSSPDSKTLETNISLLKRVVEMGKTSDEVLRQSFHWIFVVKFGGSIDRAVNHYAALSIVAASKSSQLNLTQTTPLNKLPSSITDSKH